MHRGNELKARRAANQLLDDLRITQYPVDPESIARSCRIEVVDTPGFPPHCYGGLVLADGRYRILVSTDCPTPGLRRFTVAHEVGHASIDEHTLGLAWIDRDGGERMALSEGHFRSAKNPLEVEADHFASELLMPWRWAQGLVDSLPQGMDAIREIARSFDTSLASAGVRYAALSAAPVLVVLSKDRTIEWISRSPGIDDVSFVRFQSRDSWAPAGSATAVLAGDPDAVRASGQASSAGYLSEWFPRAPSHLTVEVDAIGLGSYGRILSLIMCPNLPDPDELYLTEQKDGSEDEDWRGGMRREAGYGA